MCVFVYICLCSYVCVYVYSCMYMFVCLYLCMGVLCMYMCVYLCICVCALAYVCVWHMCVFCMHMIYVCMCVYVCTCIFLLQSISWNLQSRVEIEQQEGSYPCWTGRKCSFLMESSELWVFHRWLVLVRKVSCFTLISVFVMKRCWILLDTFSGYTRIITEFFSLNSLNISC